MNGEMPAPSHWTYDDYRRLPDDGNRYEIIAGALQVTPAPSIRHQRISLRLEQALRRPAVHAGGEIFHAPCDVYFTETSHVQPDIFYISRERASIVGETRIEGAPDLIIEVLSNSTRQRDEVEKRSLYERFAVQEYWIVDPDLETVRIYEQQSEGQYGAAAEHRATDGDPITTRLLPTLDLPLSAIFFG